MKFPILAAMAAASLATASASAQNEADGFGVLVMAHGGGEAWNGEVRDMLARSIGIIRWNWPSAWPMR